MSKQAEFHKHVWNTLKEINVAEHIEKKGQFNYLSWAWAWGIMMDHFPSIDYEFQKDTCTVTGTVEISCKVTIYGDESDIKMQRHMWLPVLNYQNKPISNPNKYNINTAKMRCLVKCFAMFGLGHAVYAGEDLIEDQPSVREETVAVSTETKKEFQRLVKEESPTKFVAFYNPLDEQVKTTLFNSFDKGEKTAMKQSVRHLEMEGNKIFTDIKEDVEIALSDDSLKYDLFEEIDNLNDQEKRYLKLLLADKDKNLALSKLMAEMRGETAIDTEDAA